MALVSEREQVLTAGPDHIELPGALPGFSGRSCKLLDPRFSILELVGSLLGIPRKQEFIHIDIIVGNP